MIRCTSHYDYDSNVHSIFIRIPTIKNQGDKRKKKRKMLLKNKSIIKSPKTAIKIRCDNPIEECFHFCNLFWSIRLFPANQFIKILSFFVNMKKIHFSIFWKRMTNYLKKFRLKYAISISIGEDFNNSHGITFSHFKTIFLL